MSADNWARCPRCWDSEVEKAATARDAVEDSYGIVSAQEYLAALEALVEPNPEQACRTLREDWEIGTWDSTPGVMNLHYRASCTECGLKAGFKAEEVFYTSDDEGQRLLDATEKPIILRPSAMAS